MHMMVLRLSLYMIGFSLFLRRGIFLSQGCYPVIYEGARGAIHRGKFQDQNHHRGRENDGRCTPVSPDCAKRTMLTPMETMSLHSMDRLKYLQGFHSLQHLLHMPFYPYLAPFLC